MPAGHIGKAGMGTSLGQSRHQHGARACDAILIDADFPGSGGLAAAVDDADVGEDGRIKVLLPSHVQ